MSFCLGYRHLLTCDKFNVRSSAKILLASFNYLLSCETSASFHVTSSLSNQSHHTSQYIKSRIYLKDKEHYTPVAHRDTVERECEPDVNYAISAEDFKWVRRLMPPSVVPEPPKHDKYPTPSGWRPPSETIPDFPYFVERTRYHEIPVEEIEKPDGTTLTVVSRINGDIWALEKELVALIRPHMVYDPATRVHEVTRRIYIKDKHKDVVFKFLEDKGF